MKNVAKSLLLAAAFLFVGAQLFASSVDYLSNRSATHVMMQSTNALTTSADAVAYNPAGTVFLPKGFSADVSNQFLFSFYTNRIGVNMGATPFSNALDGYRTVDEMNQGQLRILTDEEKEALATQALAENGENPEAETQEN